MPDKEELEQYLDAYEISQLEKMRKAAEIMNAHDKEVEHGNQDPSARLVS